MKFGEEFQAVVLAAGKGSRMNSSLPKVLLEVCGRPMISYILDSLKELGIIQPIAIISKAGGVVMETLEDAAIYVVQKNQLGSGNAVASARNAAKCAKHIIVMCGDSPLFRTSTIKSLMETHLKEGATATLLSCTLDNPEGYGRIVRDGSGRITGIVEQKVATEEQKAIKEINGGCYAFDGEWLWNNIDLMAENAAGEYCLTEMVDIAVKQGLKISAIPADPEELIGANTREQLKVLEDILLSRK